MSDVTLIDLDVSLDLESLATTLAWNLPEDDLIKFILSVDENVGDLDFTKTLAKKLKKIIKKEDAAAEKAEKERAERYGFLNEGKYRTSDNTW